MVQPFTTIALDDGNAVPDGASGTKTRLYEDLYRCRSSSNETHTSRVVVDSTQGPRIEDKTTPIMHRTGYYRTRQDRTSHRREYLVCSDLG